MTTHLAEPHQLRFRRTALLLGAGSSYDHGYPLVREFLSPQYFRWLCDQCAGLPAGHGDSAEMLREFLDGVERYRMIAPDFEQVLSAVYQNPTDYAEAVAFVYRTLATAYDITLSSDLGSTAEYLGLAMLMLEHPEDGEVSVVTFNYDTAVEDAISAMSRMAVNMVPDRRLFFRYGFRRRVLSGVPATAINMATNTPTAYPDGRVTVLKLHGSINLLFCHGCKAAVYFPFQVLTPGPAEYLKASCPDCGRGPLQPLIVPPGKRKDLPLVLQELWQAAESILETSDVVVIAGYSLPDYDEEARKLLADRVRQKPVILVDPWPSKEATAFLTSIPGVRLAVLPMTTSAFLRREVERYDPRFLATVAPHCAPVYLDQDLMQGISRAGGR